MLKQGYKPWHAGSTERVSPMPMSFEVFDALRSAGVAEDKARAAAEALANAQPDLSDIIDPAPNILVTQRSGTADAGRWRGSAVAVWIGCAYAGPQLASAVLCFAPAPRAGAPASGPH